MTEEIRKDFKETTTLKNQEDSPSVREFGLQVGTVSVSVSEPVSMSATMKNDTRNQNRKQNSVDKYQHNNKSVEKYENDENQNQNENENENTLYYIHSEYDETNHKKSKNQREECSIPMMLILSTPRMIPSMCWAAQFSGLNSYLENLMKSEYVLVLQIFGPLIGMFLSPMIGLFSDHCQSKYGRRRPFLVFGTISLLICWTIMAFTNEIGRLFGDIHGDRSITAIIAGFTFIWMGITVNIIATPAHLLLADFAGERQTMAASIGQTAFTLGSLLVAGYILVFGPAAKRLHWFIGYLQVITIAIIVLVCWVAKEIPLPTDPKLACVKTNRPSSSSSKSSDNTSLSGVLSDTWYFSAWKVIVDTWKDLFKAIREMPASVVVLGVVFFCRCYGSTSYHGGKSMFFGKVVFKGESKDADICDPCSFEQDLYNQGAAMAGGEVDTYFGIVCYLCAWLVPPMVRWIGAKNVVAVGMIPQALFLYMAIARDKVISQVVVVSTAMTMAFVDSTLVPIIVHVASKSKAMEKNIGIYVGAFNSFDCFGQLVNYGVSAFLVGGFVTTDSLIRYSLPVFVGGGTSLVGFLVALFLLKINLFKV